VACFEEKSGAMREVKRPSRVSVDTALTAIKTGLESRSEKQSSVNWSRGGRGFDWLLISSPLKRRDEDGRMDDNDRVELARLLDLDSVGPQGRLVQARSAWLREFVQRARGEWRP
jgi:hypothetical protein